MICATLALIVLVVGLTGCSGDSAGLPESELRLAAVNLDGTGPYHLGITAEGVQRYEFNLGETAQVNFVWTPAAPAGLRYEVTHSVNGAVQPSVANSKGGEAEIDGHVRIPLNTYGFHLITVDAYAGQNQVGHASVQLEAGKGG